MPRNVNAEAQVRAAVSAFWRARRKAERAKKKKDQGERSSVTAGKNMDAFAEVTRDIVVSHGLPSSSIYLNRGGVEVPGYFRPNKAWDLVVVHHEVLVAALEFKSHVGPSFGNNFNNRCEEAIGNAVDLNTAIREGQVKIGARPFLGYLMLLEDADESRRPRRATCKNFPIAPEFKNASYAERYREMCRRLVLEGWYTSTALLLSKRSATKNGEFVELDRDTGIRQFFAALSGQI